MRYVIGKFCSKKKLYKAAYAESPLGIEQFVSRVRMSHDLLLGADA